MVVVYIHSIVLYFAFCFARVDKSRSIKYQAYIQVDRLPGKNNHEREFKPQGPFQGPRIIDDYCSCHGVLPLFELHPLLDCLGLSDRLLPLEDQGFPKRARREAE
ncbi:hypothetical protein FPOAC2_09522 [Fusarium poae]